MRTFIRRLVRIQQHCPALPFALSVALGQTIAWFLLAPESQCLLVLLGVLAVALGRRTPALVTGAVLGLCSGWWAAEQRVGVLSAPDVQIIGVVEEEPRHPRTGEVVFVVRVPALAGHPRIRCRAVELPWRNVADIARGDTVWIRGPLEAVSRPFNPFSWEGRLYRRSISGEISARWVSQPISRAPGMISRLRGAISSAVEERYGDRRGAALFLSMGFGFQDRLSSFLEDAFKALGLTHLLVVSGYQVSLVFGFCSWGVTLLMTSLRMGSHVRRLVTALSFSVAALYVVVVGAEMSALRALIAAACVGAAFVWEHASRFSQRLGVALLLLELMSPWAFFDLGVQLTFAALTGIGIGTVLGGSSSWKTYCWIAVSTWSFTSGVLHLWGASLSLTGVLFNICLASVWSVINCVGGTVGFVLLLLGGDSASAILDAVVLINEWIAAVVVWASEDVGLKSYKPEGIGVRLGVGIAWMVLCGFLIRKAQRAYGASRMLALVAQ
jgi:ComEC/Rec2-related protein